MIRIDFINYFTNGAGIIIYNEKFSTKTSFVETEEEEVTFLVDSTESNLPCVVGYTLDDINYVRLFGEKLKDNIYKFSVVPVEGIKVIVALKGDVDGNQKLTSNDSSLINRHIVKTVAHKALNPLQAFIGDVDCNGKLTSNDSSLINRHIVKTAAHKTLKWDGE